MLHNLLKVQSLDDDLGDGLCHNESRAISSLVAQANSIFPHWDGCGYIHHPDTRKRGDDDEMRMWPCDSNFVRTFKNGNLGNLGNCYANIPGLSQTCKFYHECGTRTRAIDWNKDVRASEIGDFYQEPEVQRKCGICSMASGVSSDYLNEFGKSGASLRVPRQHWLTSVLAAGVVVSNIYHASVNRFSINTDSTTVFM